MIKYDIRSGAKKIKTKTAIIASTAVLGISGLGMAVVVPAVSNAAAPASCDAQHGAPGGYGPDSPYWTVAAPQGGVGGYRMGQAQGVVTGQFNSGLSATCNQG